MIAQNSEDRALLFGMYVMLEVIKRYPNIGKDQILQKAMRILIGQELEVGMNMSMEDIENKVKPLVDSFIKDVEKEQL